MTYDVDDSQLRPHSPPEFVKPQQRIFQVQSFIGQSGLAAGHSQSDGKVLDSQNRLLRIRQYG